MICSIEKDRELDFPVWDPRGKKCDDWYDVMPIITPAYPCRNSTVHVSASTLKVMKEQFRIGNKICQVVFAIPPPQSYYCNKVLLLTVVFPALPCRKLR
jgi:poly(A) polymerase Pap1